MEERLTYFAHSTATIDEPTQIGSGTKIWHYSHIMPNTWIGDDCVLGQNVYIANNIIIGDKVKIQNNVSLYEGVLCESDVFIGPSAVFTNVINPRSAVERKSEYKKTILKKGCSIGANATILCGVTIGAYAFIGAGAVVTKDIPSFALVVGNPSHQIGWISAHGERLHFDHNNKAKCHHSGATYHIENNIVTQQS